MPRWALTLVSVADAMKLWRASACIGVPTCIRLKVKRSPAHTTTDVDTAWQSVAVGRDRLQRATALR